MLSRKRDRYRYAGQQNGGQTAYPQRLVIAAQSGPVPDPAGVFICSEPMVYEAVRFIASNVKQNLWIEDVARHLNTSRSTLIRRFDEAMGRSVTSEIARQRVAHLKQLLAETDRSIAEISRECGFSSPAHLSRFFNREVGVTPSAYRRGRIVPHAAVAYGAGTHGA